MLGSGTLWEQPDAGLAFAGAGSAWEMLATGPGRFGQVSSAMRKLQSSLVRDDDAIFPCLGGFAFGEHDDGSHIWADFPDARLVVPKVLIQNDGLDALLRVTIQIDPRSTAGDVEEKIDDLFQRARGWINDPLSLEQNSTAVRSESFPTGRAGNRRSPPLLP